MFYIVGRLVNEIRELWDQGPRDYCSQLWKILDFVMLSTFITSFSLKAVSYRYYTFRTVDLKMNLRLPKMTLSNVNKWYGKWNELFDKWDVTPYEVNVACKENDGQLSYHASYAKGKLSQ